MQGFFKEFEFLKLFKIIRCGNVFFAASHKAENVKPIFGLTSSVQRQQADETGDLE
jgi:hypothetical protein